MQISEILPNPIGKDPAGEWIKLFNDSLGPVDLAGWQIKDASGKTFVFKNQNIAASEHLTLDYKTTKIFLNNDGETLFLYDQKGGLVDKAEFVGTVPEGKIVKRQGDFFVFNDEQSPGKAEQKNARGEPVESAFQEVGNSGEKNYPITLDKKAFGLDILTIAIFVAAALAFIFVIVFRKIEEGSG